MRSVICDTDVDQGEATIGYQRPGVNLWLLKADPATLTATWTQDPWQAQIYTDPDLLGDTLAWLISRGLQGYEIPVRKLEPAAGVAHLPTT